MHDLFFYVFAALTLLCGVLVLVSRNPVTSAMFLVLTIASMAGLFVLLHAFFLAAVQVLVYAGSVMVLFLFVIMLLHLKEEERRAIKLVSFVMGLATVGVVGAILVNTIFQSEVGKGVQPNITGGTAQLGGLLFTQYLLPFEIVSVLLLVAMVGVVLLSKKELK